MKLSRRAFTLAEIAIAIVIISIMAGITGYAYTKVAEEARVTKVTKGVRNVKETVEAYTLSLGPGEKIAVEMSDSDQFKAFSEKVIKGIPKTNYFVKKDDANEPRDIIVGFRNIDGKEALVAYYPVGSKQECVLDDALYVNPNNPDELFGQAPDGSDYKKYFNGKDKFDSNSNFCAVSLINNTKLIAKSTEGEASSGGSGTGSSGPLVISSSANTRGGDIYINGAGFTTDSVGVVDGTNCQATKFISSTKLRCTLPPKDHDTTNEITVSGAGEAEPNKVVIYNNNSQGAMQDFTSANCASMKRGQAIVLTDTRISKGESAGRDYRVKKMADDKCWMIDNLRYADPSWTQPTSGQWMTINKGYYPISDQNWGAFSYLNPGDSTVGCPPGSSAGCYGYLYNWYTATGEAGRNSVLKNGQNVNGSICPNNSNASNIGADLAWELPTGGENDVSDFAILNTAMKDDNEDNSFVSGNSNYSIYSSWYNQWQPDNTFQGTFSGEYSIPYNDFVGHYGYYWSSTAYSSYTAYNLYILNSHVNPGTRSNNKTVGLTVRCLVR